MTKMEQLQADRKTAADAAKAIKDNASKDGLTDEEEAAIQAEVAKIRDCSKAIKDEEARVARLAALDVELAQATAEANAAQPFKTGEAAKSSASVRVENVSKPFNSFGHFLHLVREAGQSVSVSADLNQRIKAAAPGMMTGIDEDGGHLVAPEFANELLRKMYDNGAIVSRCRKIGPLAGNTITIPYVNETSRAAGSRAGGVRGYWVNEAGAITDSKPKFGAVELKPKKVAVLGYVTEEMVADYAAVEGLLETLFAEELTFMVEDAIVNGTGAGQPLGILNAPCKVGVTKETNQTAATVWGPNVAKMLARMPARNRMSAVWLIDQSVETQLPGLTLEGRWGSETTSVQGVQVNYISAGSLLNATGYGMLANIPVIPCEYCAALGTAGDIILFDPQSYLLADKGGPQMAASIHVRFLYDERTYRLTYRVDGQPWWSSAVTPKSAGDTLSPVVTLNERS